MERHTVNFARPNRLFLDSFGDKKPPPLLLKRLERATRTQVLKRAVDCGRFRLDVLNAERGRPNRAAMIDLQSSDLEAVDMERCPSVCQPPFTLEPERSVRFIVAPAGSRAAYPHHTAGDRIERALFDKALQCGNRVFCPLVHLRHSFRRTDSSTSKPSLSQRVIAFPLRSPRHFPSDDLMTKLKASGSLISYTVASSRPRLLLGSAAQLPKDPHLP